MPIARPAQPAKGFLQALRDWVARHKRLPIGPAQSDRVDTGLGRISRPQRPGGEVRRCGDEKIRPSDLTPVPRARRSPSTGWRG
jgi:hypothetical protein